MFSCVHMLLKYLSHPLQLLFKSSIYFNLHVWRCGYCLSVVSDQADGRLDELLTKQQLAIMLNLVHVTRAHAQNVSFISCSTRTSLTSFKSNVYYTSRAHNSLLRASNSVIYMYRQNVPPCTKKRTAIDI